MSASLMRSIRAKSLLIYFLFTSLALPHGNDARSLIARRMRYDHQTCGQQAQRDESFFAAGEAVVLESDAGAGKNLIRVLEAEPVLGEVCPVFSFIPLVLHFRSL